MENALKLIEDKRVMKFDEDEHKKTLEGPCPTFRFMPTKVQFMKMIIKAAFNPTVAEEVSIR